MDTSLTNHVIKSFENAENFISKIDEDILNLDGMTGQCTRHLFLFTLLMIGIGLM